MVLGARPGAANDSIALTADHCVAVPHEMPGQDPEGGSEVNFGLVEDSSSVSGTPRGSTGLFDGLRYIRVPMVAGVTRFAAAAIRAPPP